MRFIGLFDIIDVGFPNISLEKAFEFIKTQRLIDEIKGFGFTGILHIKRENGGIPENSTGFRGGLLP